MVVDDAVVVRGLVSRWLIDEGGFEVAASCRSAIEALDLLPTTQPDVVILDIEMPELDGLTALPMLLELRPDMAVIVATSLASRQADLALRCLERGALDFIAKPSSNRDFSTSLDFRTDLLMRVRALGLRTLRRQAPLRPGTRPAATGSAPAVSATAWASPVVPAPVASGPEHLPIAPISAAPPPASPATGIKPAVRRPSLVAIGASTGGPNAIMGLLGQIRPVIRRVPIVVVQHMPSTFTAIFADHLRRQIGVDAREVRDQELIVPGQVHVAPGGRHLRLDAARGGIRASLDDSPPVNYCRPSVDVLFESAAASLGSSVVAVVLTGMGTDGTAGALAVHRAGGAVFVQDEGSSVVWGMPGSVYKTGVARGMGSIAEIAQMLGRFVGAEAA